MRWLVPILILFALCGCRSRILKKYCANDTVQVVVQFTDTVRDTVVIKGDSIGFHFNPDQIKDSIEEIYRDSITTILAVRDGESIRVSVKTRERIIPVEKIVYRNIPVKVKANCEACYLTKAEFEKRRVWFLLAFVGLILLMALLLRR